MLQFVNLDAAETVFFARELESKAARSYDVIKAPLKAFELFPVDTSDGPGCETISYKQFDQTGIAKIIGNYADDLPRANVKGKEFFAKVKSVGNSYGYSLQEIRAAQFANRPLDQMQANAAARAQREKWNRIAFYGDAEYDLQGFLTNVNIPEGTVVAGAALGTAWSTKTPDEIIKDVNEMINSVIALTNGAEQVNTVAMPIAQYTLINTTPRSATSDTTILQFLQNSHPGVEFMWANELDSAQLAANGVTRFTGDVMMAYRRDPEVVQLKMPVLFETLPVQEKGLEYEIPCHSRIGGVVVRYPLAAVFRDGI